MKFYFPLFLLFFLYTTNNFAQTLVVKKSKGYYGVQDKKTKETIIPFEYDFIEDIGIQKSFFLVSKANKHGVLNDQNQFIIPLDCDSIVSSNEFRTSFYVYKNLKIGYVTYKGATIPIDYESIKDIKKDNFITKRDGKFGIINIANKLIYPHKYDEILSFEEDYLCAKLDGEWVGVRENVVVDRGDDVVFYTPDQIALFPPCGTNENKIEKIECSKKNISEYIIENLVYPEKAIEYGKEGYVIIGYIVDITGEITEMKMIRDIDGLFEEECKRLLQNFPTLIPAQHEGRNVKYATMQPIRFKLK